MSAIDTERIVCDPLAVLRMKPSGLSLAWCPFAASAPLALAALAFAALGCAELESTPLATVQSKAPAVRKWEHERSDIPADPRIHFGRLDNGMRYAWMQNAEPKQRCYLRLHVDVGSLAEKDDERGMAHFLEHMAFNGSKHYPAGSLVEWFQRHGMAFGADTNASTSFSETVYQIDLPTSDKGSIVEGLGVLRDFADGLLLEKKEIDSERGVIDAEEREHDSPEYRMLVRGWQIELSGTRIPQRDPIGVKAVRDQFTPDAIRAFYRRWYRAENFTFLLVGDLGDLDPAPLIEKTFADMRSPSEALDLEPPVGIPTFQTRFFAIPEKDASSVTLSIERAIPWEDWPDDKAEIRKNLPLRFARSMLDLRFEELAKREGAPFLSASAYTLRGDGLRAEDGEGLSITCTAEKWAEALAACELELRRAVELGFEERELAEVRADWLRNLDEGVEREKTRSSASCIGELVGAAESRLVPAAAATERAIFKPSIDALDVKACAEAFAAAWKKGTLIVAASGNLDLGPDAAKTLSEAYEAGEKTPVEARAKEEDRPFAYASDASKAGEIASRSHMDEFDLEEVLFANGVRLHVKKTDFKKKQILVAAAIGEGRLSIDGKQQALAFATSRAYEECGLGAHGVDELRRLDAGKAVQVGFGMDDDRFELGGVTTQEDLLRELELLRAYLTDPGWREEGLRQLQKGIPVYFDAIEHQHGGPITTKFLPELYSADDRYRFPERAEIEAVTTAAMREWLVPRLDEAPIDLVVVGDLDLDAVVTAAARTFGELPRRRTAKAFEERRKPAQLKTGLRLRYEIETDVEKTLVLIVFPATDGREATMRRRLSFLAEVLSDRLRVEVREKLGASYSPGAGTNLSEIIPEDGWIAIQAMAEPDKVDDLVEACLKVTDGMADKGLSSEEVERQRKPALAEVRDRLRTNGYWLSVLSRLHTHDHVFGDLRSFTQFFETVQASELDPLAKEYFKRDRANVAIVAPRKKSAASEAKGTDAAAPKKD